MAEAEYKSEIKRRTETPYLTGEQWGVYDEDLGENWLTYNSIALYMSTSWWNTVKPLI